MRMPRVLRIARTVAGVLMFAFIIGWILQHSAEALNRGNERAGFGRGVALADAVANVGDGIRAAHILLLQEVDRVTLALGEQRDQHVRASDFVAPR